MEQKKTKPQPKVIVLDRGYGSAISIIPGQEIYAQVMVRSREMQITDGRIKPLVKEAEISGKLSTILNYGFEPNDVMSGHIVRKYSLEPPVGEDPEQFILTDENGKYIKTESGSHIWSFTYYTEDPMDIDELCPE